MSTELERALADLDLDEDRTFELYCAIRNYVTDQIDEAKSDLRADINDAERRISRLED